MYKIKHDFEMCTNAFHICQIKSSVLDESKRINLDDISEVESIINDNKSEQNSSLSTFYLL